MRKLIVLGIALLCAVSMFAYKHDFKTVEGDPLNALEYTLPNGLKVFMTVNRDQPRIQTYVAVRVGGKNDPAETTGLAHYFEHLMFKGTQQFGTQDYAKEKPLLDKIENLFETYRHTTDSAARAAIYHEIDSVSYLASTIAIPNEYDKLMAAIGADGTNAYTSTDVTCYVEDIPSNQIDNWARIQADRFMHPVLRGFHTELETIYEEKNMSLTNDGRKCYEALLAGLFPHHPYGTQTVLGTQDHLKNPSITNVKNYHTTWYVPNNMAICLSGDFDPDMMVDTIEKYFGAMQPNLNMPARPVVNEQAITEPIKVEVLGKEAPMLMLGWRVPEAKSPDMLTLQVLSEVLNNGKCGIMDLNLSLPQRLQSAGGFIYDMADGGALVLSGKPKQDQSLDDVRALLLEQIDSLRNGKFSDELISAVKANLKLSVQQSFEKNSSRANHFVDAFVNGQPWADAVTELKAIDNVTKADVVAAANKYLGANNYVAIYKEQGTDPGEKKMPKPALTPIATNRDKASEFLVEIQNSAVEPIEPVFVDFDKDITRASAKDGAIEVLYTPNVTNDIFQLSFVYDYGTYAERKLAMAAQYLKLVGTPSMTPAQVAEAFYSLACGYSVSAGTKRTFVTIYGLSENMNKALALYEKLVAEAQHDPQAWQSLVERNIKALKDAKANQRQSFSRLSTYARYGNPDNNPTLQMGHDPEYLQSLDGAEVLNSLRALNNYKHRVIYYGPAKLDNVLATLNNDHHTAASLADVPVNREFKGAVPEETVIYIAPYDAAQLYMAMISDRDEKYDTAVEPARSLYNEYFGGSMNAIVFQEMRESRSLAYSAFAVMQQPSRAKDDYTYYAQIATQNDKLMDAVDAFNQIINDMPVSPAAFDLAKAGLDARDRTTRTIHDEIAWAVINAEDLGLKENPEPAIFKARQGMTIDDVIAYQKAHVKDGKYHYAILGRIADLDLDALAKYGRIVILTPEDTFGY